jgi:UDP-glucose 6-dehydrogenase
MKYLLLFIALPILFACKTPKDATTKKDQKANEMTEITAKLGDITTFSDPIDIIEAKIEGNYLLLKVGYGGGCEEHTFELIGSTEIAKSMPPIRSIKLIHKANNDRCKAYMYENIKINISELSDRKIDGSTIILKGEQFKEKMSYTFIK